MKSAFSLEKQQIIPPSPRNVVIGHGILLLGARCLYGRPSGLSELSLEIPLGLAQQRR
jgi:hypothetical protein